MIVSNESYEDERLRWRKSEEWCAVRDVMQQEYQSLKDETKELRQCQTTFFWSSITATGAVLAFATNSVIANKNLTESYSILLQLFTLIAPLFIVNPVWCIFMDKASSVTRITGYLRVLEDMIIKREKSGLFYTSWENAIKIYREWQYHEYKRKEDAGGCRFKSAIQNAYFGKNSGFWVIWKFRMPNQYNILSWQGFFWLSFACWILFTISAIHYSTESIYIHLALLWAFATFIFFGSLTYTLHVIRLIHTPNERSTRFREQKWRELLGNTEENFDANGIHKLFQESND